MSRFKALKEEAWEANREIPRQGLALYTWGNVSAFDASLGVFAIKPSGVPYDELQWKQMVVLDLEGTVIEGDLNPSSDTPTHRILYRYFSERSPGAVTGIIHTHSTHAVAWAQAAKDIPLYGTTHADHLQLPVPCTAFLGPDAVERNYEEETGNLIVETFRERNLDPAQVPMVLVAGHGPFAWGATPLKAVYNGAVLEEVAAMALLTQQVNPAAVPLPEHIVRKHYLRKHGPNAYYGQK